MDPRRDTTLGHLVVDLIADHLTEIESRPVFQSIPDDLARRFLSLPAPVEGLPADDVLGEFRDTIEPYPLGLTAEYADRLRAIARADSVAIDPHKWLFVPVEAGLVMVRAAEDMRAAFSLVPPYLRSARGVGGLPWFSEYGFQQTRGFRALKVWMTVKQAGLSGLTAAIEENLALARYLADRVRSDGDLELMATPSLSIVCFRMRNRTLSGDALDAFNRAVLERLQLGGEAFLTGTELRGRFVLRACIVNYRSRREDIDRMLAETRAIAKDLASAGS